MKLASLEIEQIWNPDKSPFVLQITKITGKYFIGAKSIVFEVLELFQKFDNF